jgi:hypothetical protein
VSLALGVGGWSVERLWLYLMGSAGMILVGGQLVTFWILLQVLEELSQRESNAEVRASGSQPREASDGRTT